MKAFSVRTSKQRPVLVLLGFLISSLLALGPIQVQADEPAVRSGY